MKILGNRVYLNLPKIEESKFSISDELKKELREKEIQKFDKLTVYAVGEGIPGITISVKVGDKVFADPVAIRRGTILKIEDKELICVNSQDIMHVW
jgi:co-chaperonin GroES (HSP10)